MGNGKFCLGATKMIQGCNYNVRVHPHPEPCQWKDWSPWDKCSSECGPGEQKRSREVLREAQNNGSPCYGASAEVQQCQVKKCPPVPGPRPCQWGDWNEWGACDKCGGQRKRNRM